MMLVHRHAEHALVAMQGRLPEAASVYLARLRELKVEPNKSIALEVARLQFPAGRREAGGTNGDMVVAIIRDEQVITVMLRRSWNQAFTPEVLRVDQCISLEGAVA